MNKGFLAPLQAFGKLKNIPKIVHKSHESHESHEKTRNFRGFLISADSIFLQAMIIRVHSSPEVT